jgi:hypothetical protein
MTFSTEYKGLLLGDDGIAADAVIKEAKNIGYVFEHWHERRVRGRDEDWIEPERPPPAAVFDFNPLLRRSCYSAVAIAKSNGPDCKQVSMQTLLDLTMQEVRNCTVNGCDLVILRADTFVPKIKLATAQKRDRKRAAPAPAASTPLAAEVKGGDAAASPRSTAYIDGAEYAAVGGNTEHHYCIREGQLVKVDKASGIIVAATTQISPAHAIENRQLRKSLIEWIMENIARKESTKFQNTLYVLDFVAGQPATCWRNGKRVTVNWNGFSTVHWGEADHAIGTWSAALTRAGRDVVVWTLDGDLLLILNWVVFHMRYPPPVPQEASMSRDERVRALDKVLASTGFARVRAQERNLCALVIDYAITPVDVMIRPLADEMNNNCGYLATPATARFHKHEPHVICVLQGNGGGKTTLVSMNMFNTILCNRYLFPSHLTMTAMLTDNDYVDKNDVSYNVGMAKIRPALFSLYPSTHAKLQRALWMFAFRGFQLSAKQKRNAVTPAAQADAIAQMVTRVVQEHMGLPMIKLIGAEVGDKIREAMYMWYRCAMVTDTECLPTTVTYYDRGLTAESILDCEASSPLPASSPPPSLNSDGSSGGDDDIDPDALRDHYDLFDLTPAPEL